jgi:hypothetical protein
MSSIGVNKSGITQNLELGKDLGTFKTEKEAKEKAHRNKGSEVIYQDSNNDWHVNELTEQGVVYGHDAISVKDKDKVELNVDNIKPGIKHAIISFVEDSDLEVYTDKAIQQQEQAEQKAMKEGQLKWAAGVKEQAENGVEPSDQEKIKYQLFTGKELTYGHGNVSQNDFDWYNKMNNKINNENYQPRQLEAAKLDRIAELLK